MTETRIDPFTPPRPTEAELRGKTVAEQDAMIAAMRSEWSRVRGVELARQDGRRAHIASGGDGEAFDRTWSETGEAAHISDQAKQRQERARVEGSVF
jgi:hypothetical protein